ncbi:type II secretion system protein [Oceaniovalibus guishaninsula JLT2003]|uniref:Type II secretion system protein n=1 Tax=Oceaniovalibus guishaninsula JLT2003 TaxID=1231392 RepID=K2HCW4_9RHOB|nr:type II secretion system F family protein [Oceaniovalibus guishaninsula]EKE44432.1 type II secretion system protein [Oceaniovalibus guishaninsula JLT2003]
MTGITTLLTSLGGPLGPLIATGLLGVLLILAALPFLLQRRTDPLDRLRARKSQPETAEPTSAALRVGGRNDKLARFSTFLEPQDATEYSAARLKLLQAGYRGKNAVRVFHFAQFALGIALLILGLLYALTTSAGAEPSMQSMILYTLGPGALGYLAPRYWVTRRQQERKDEIVRGFPDSLDMMLVCVEAGQSLDQSITRVAKEIRAGFPALADEYDMVAHETKAGKDKSIVLRDMSERAGVTDISSFVTVLIQSATFGTSIADALRVFSDEMRDKRVMRAEEKANTLPTKMTLATMMLTVPPLLIILLGPSVNMIIETFSQLGV